MLVGKIRSFIVTESKERFMAKQRKTIGATRKAKVALEAIKEQSTVRELSAKYKIHTTQIHSWKKKLIAEAPELFERGYAGSREQELQQREAELFEEIGRLKMELEWLKKKLIGSAELRRSLVEPGHPELRIRRQCELLGLPRSTFYLEPAKGRREDG